MLLLLYGVFGNSFVMAIIIATILIRMITLPLTLPQQRNSRKMAELAPQLEELKKKYGNDRTKMSPGPDGVVQAEQRQHVWRLSAVDFAARHHDRVLSGPDRLAGDESAATVATLSQVMPALVPLIPINPIFLIYDLGLPGILPAVQQAVSPLVAQLLVFILPVLVVATTYLSQKLMAPPSADPSQASMTKQMNLIMPMMFGLFALQFASGLSIYFIVSNVVGAAANRG